MAVKSFIFDFDGTLVHSNKIKREAFYEVIKETSDQRSIVDEVLAAMPEGSRFEIIREIFSLISKSTGAAFDQTRVQKAVNKYSSLVRERILACPELEGATSCLSKIHQSGGTIFISSNTPEQFLGELIEARKWNKLISGFFGFPRKKEDTVSYVLTSLNLSPSEVLVVGDGPSDELSAAKNGCLFFKIAHDRSLVELTDQISKNPEHV